MSTPAETSPNESLAPKVGTITRASRGVASDLWILSDGIRLQFRPIGSDDRDGLAGLFRRAHAGIAPQAIRLAEA